MKTCKKCNTNKPTTAFARHPQTRDGFAGNCKACENVARNIRRLGKPPRKDGGWPARSPESALRQYAAVRAREQGVAITITKADIVIPDFCPCLGIPLARGAGKHQAGSPSIDRIDPARGYTPDNIWVISRRANVIKSDATLAELEMIVAALRRIR